MPETVTDIALRVGVVCASLVYASFFEWTLHKHVMHRHIRWFPYPFKTHACTHHRIYQADATYHHRGQDPPNKITMAWWNGPALVATGMVPVLFLLAPFWIHGSQRAAELVASTAVVVFAVYYCMYEYLHWCMHFEKNRWVERRRFFRWLNGHHLLHHRYVTKNLNVVLPLADWFLGTLLIRSPVRFAQARGPAVPDVQPLS